MTMCLQNTLAMLPMLLITAVSGEAATLRKLEWGGGDFSPSAMT